MAAARMLAARRVFTTAPSRRLQTLGRVTPRRPVPADIVAPAYVTNPNAVPREYPAPMIHSEGSQQLMRRASAVAADVLQHACDAVQPGMTTDDLDAIVHDYALRKRVYPSPLMYMGFPKSVCTSINEVVCHGIPDADAVIQHGDIVKLDVSVFVDGVHGDTCRTVIAGGAQATDEAGRTLVETTKRALNAAIAACGPGLPVTVIGNVIEPILRAAGYGCIKEFAGHGIGEYFHTEPLIYHHAQARGLRSPLLRPGMTFTIEPMVVEGDSTIKLLADGWTVATVDGSRGAQFEHTLLVTAHGIDVLTAYE